MTTTTTTQTNKTHTKTPPTPEFLNDAWDTALKAQRQWFGLFTQPFGFVPAPEKMWKRWQKLSTECLEQTEQSFDRMKDFVADEVRMVRDFSEKAVEMTKDVDEDAPPTFKPELARAWFDTSWRCIERGVDFNTKSVKIAEELGMKFSEMLMKEPTTKTS